MTLRQFITLLRQVDVLISFELGGEIQPRILSAEAQHKLALSMFGGRR